MLLALKNFYSLLWKYHHYQCPSYFKMLTNAESRATTMDAKKLTSIILATICTTHQDNQQKPGWNAVKGVITIHNVSVGHGLRLDITDSMESTLAICVIWSQRDIWKEEDRSLISYQDRRIAMVWNWLTMFSTSGILVMVGISCHGRLYLSSQSFTK